MTNRGYHGSRYLQIINHFQTGHVRIIYVPNYTITSLNRAKRTESDIPTYLDPTTVIFVFSILGPLSTSVNIIISDDIVFTKVAASLHFYERKGKFARVFHAMRCAEGDVD